GTGVERVVTDAVVDVGEVPQVVGDDPEPEHVGPDHVLGLVARDVDADPAADGQQVEDAGDAVHPVPRPAHHVHAVVHALQPGDLEVPQHRLGDVDRQDERREHQHVLVASQSRDVADEHEAQTAGQRRVDFDPVEPGTGGGPGGRGGGPHE